MTRLALAVGYLSVFGLVAYVIVVLLTNAFKEDKKEDKKE